MKGIIIYERPFMGFDYVRAANLNNADYKFELSPSEDAKVTLSGSFNVSAQAKCSKDDTYDFETGALISLMKMCGLEKSAKAYAEIFDDTAYGDALIERDKLKEEVKSLKASICAKKVINRRLLKDYNFAQSAYEIMVEKSADLMDKVKELEKENKELKGNIDELFKSDQHTKSELGRLYFEKHRLEEENEKLKLDCEKLQHGYIDNEKIFCGGRQNGKQFTFLVDLFKKIDQKKVDAAYKEAYDNWCLKFGGKRPVCTSIDEWAYKIPTKREQMWEDIKEGKIGSIKVEKAFINDFLSEAEEHGLVWGSGGEKPTEWDKWESWRRFDYIVFIISGYTKTKELTWGVVSNENTIDYLPPMRWDLFKKGRIAVKVSKENYADFCSRILSHFTKVGISAWNHACKFGYFVFNKDTNYVERISVSDNGDIKEINRRKVVDWEDVR